MVTTTAPWTSALYFICTLPIPPRDARPYFIGAQNFVEFKSKKAGTGPNGHSCISSMPRRRGARFNSKVAHLDHTFSTHGINGFGATI
uniref:Uncharacterized protein n=1 Tax=Physcomitrium patens TaxID=3218 RepID=A0A2K1KWA2_PHYPA|nr:hypothetical protein PHYPA_005048 [Physcomitrium patens]